MQLLVLPVSAVLGIVVTRLIVENYGTAAFAQYGLLVEPRRPAALRRPRLCAAVMNAVAGGGDPATDDASGRVLVTAVRVLLVSAAVLALVVLGVAAVGGWPTLLGPGLLPGSGGVPRRWASCSSPSTMPFGIGQRILTGLGRNHVPSRRWACRHRWSRGRACSPWAGVPAGADVAVFAYGGPAR